MISQNCIDKKEKEKEKSNRLPVRYKICGGHKCHLSMCSDMNICGMDKQVGTRSGSHFEACFLSYRLSFLLSSPLLSLHWSDQHTPIFFSTEMSSIQNLFHHQLLLAYRHPMWQKQRLNKRKNGKKKYLVIIIKQRKWTDMKNQDLNSFFFFPSNSNHESRAQHRKGFKREH